MCLQAQQAAEVYLARAGSLYKGLQLVRMLQGQMLWLPLCAGLLQPGQVSQPDAGSDAGEACHSPANGIHPEGVLHAALEIMLCQQRDARQ